MFSVVLSLEILCDVVGRGEDYLLGLKILSEIKEGLCYKKKIKYFVETTLCHSFPTLST
mgnify:CR=1 FL=1